MKKIFMFTCLLVAVLNGYSQDFMDVIVEKSCGCIEQIPDSLDTDQFNMALGVCMIEAAMPYKKQIKKEYNIDLDNINEDGEKLGRIIGIKLAMACPNTMLSISKRTLGEDEIVEVEDVEQSIEGVVTKIENDFFVNFSVKDNVGKITKLYWLTFVESSVELSNNYPAIMGKKVKVTYNIQDFFDPKLAEYRQFFIITKLEIINE